MGHEQRCRVLFEALTARGNEIVNEDEDILVLDYPRDLMPRDSARIRVLMGCDPIYPTDYAWYPLGPSGPRTLTGHENLILDPELIHHLRGWEAMDEQWLLTMGGGDPQNLTEGIAGALYDVPLTVVLGPLYSGNFTVSSRLHEVRRDLSRTQFLRLLGQHAHVICGWGQTAFEALYLGCLIMPVAHCEEHKLEARRLGVDAHEPQWIVERVSQDIVKGWRRPGLDLGGADRVVSWLEQIYEGES